MDVFCSICGKRWTLPTLAHLREAAVTYHGNDEWTCVDESACLDRKTSQAAVMDARDNPVPVIAAREDLEATVWRVGPPDGASVDEIMAAADRYASAAVADPSGADAILGPARLAEATAEAETHKKGRHEHP